MQLKIIRPMVFMDGLTVMALTSIAFAFCEMLLFFFFRNNRQNSLSDSVCPYHTTVGELFSCNGEKKINTLENPVLIRNLNCKKNVQYSKESEDETCIS